MAASRAALAATGAALLCAALIAVAAVATLDDAARTGGSPTTLVAPAAAARRKMNAAVNLAGKVRPLDSHEQAVESLKPAANKAAADFLSQAIGDFARAHPRMAGQKAMSHVLADTTTVHEVISQVQGHLMQHLRSTQRSSKLGKQSVPNLAKVAVHRGIEKMKAALRTQMGYNSLSAADKERLHKTLAAHARVAAEGFIGMEVQNRARRYPKAPGRAAMDHVVNSRSAGERVLDQVENELSSDPAVLGSLPAHLHKYVPIVARGVAMAATEFAVRQLRHALSSHK